MQLGWVDFSKSDREKVLDVMNLLQETGAVDELGIGLIRDGFANLFFPGTSTVQTRAKYFVIIPYVLKEAVDGKFGKDMDKILRKIDEEERNCGNLLMEHCPGASGIIGQRFLPRRWVVRKPSNIYWNGIRTFHIFEQGSMSIPEMIRLSLFVKAGGNDVKLGNCKDDGENDKDDADAGKDKWYRFFKVPNTYYTDWRSDLHIELNKDEAVFLRNCIETSVSDSFLAVLLKNNVDVRKYEYFEALVEDTKELVSDELCHQLELACDFNRLVYTMRVRYNWILGAGNNEAANKEWVEIEADLDHMISVDINKVFASLGIVDYGLRKFLDSLKQALADKNFREADDLLVAREVKLKTKSRAKLCHREDYGSDVWIGGRYLDYRFNSAKIIITDIYTGEEVPHV